jgi:hypothetical protein
VHLRVDGTPGAEVVLDGVSSGHVPLELSLPRAADRRSVAVRLSGHQPWTREIAGDVDVVLVAALTPTPEPEVVPPDPPPATKGASKPTKSGSKSSTSRDAPVVRNPFR